MSKSPWDDEDSPPPQRPHPGGNGPWGKPRGPSGPQRNGDLERQLRRIEDRLRHWFSGENGLKPQGVAALAAAAGLLWAASGVYFVQADEAAVITRLGGYHRTETPGLRYRLPAPFEQHQKVRVTTANRTDVGFVGQADSRAKQDRPEESLMLTGDENIVDIEFSVFWRVNDAPDYVFNLANPDAAIKAAAESVMREVIGTSDLTAIITTGRARIQNAARDQLQKTLDQWGAGVTISQVQIQRADPPSEVIEAFREVVNAGQDAESAINEAIAYKNRVVPEARGDAAKITQAAEAYRERISREAAGEADRFNQLYAQYRLAPGVTKERLYLETMERVLARADKVLVDSRAGSTPVILPLDRSKPVPPPPVLKQTPSNGAAQ